MRQKVRMKFVAQIGLMTTVQLLGALKSCILNLLKTQRQGCLSIPVPTTIPSRAFQWKPWSTVWKNVRKNKQNSYIPVKLAIKPIQVLLKQFDTRHNRQQWVVLFPKTFIHSFGILNTSSAVLLRRHHPHPSLNLNMMPAVVAAAQLFLSNGMDNVIVVQQHHVWFSPQFQCQLVGWFGTRTYFVLLSLFPEKGKLL